MRCLLNGVARVQVLTRLIPDARGTSCDEQYERISGTERAAIVRIPFRDHRSVPQPSNCSAYLPFMK